MALLLFSHLTGAFTMYIQSHWRELIFYFFLLSSSVQLFYYLYFFSRLAFYRSKPGVTPAQQAVSIIICTRDEEANLRTNLPQVLRQHDHALHEVIVVNHNSKDNSHHLLEELAKDFRQLHPLHLERDAEEIPGKKFPLSVGIQEAKNEILLLTDADCVPASGLWLQKMKDGYRAGTEVVLGYGAYQKRQGLVNKLIRFDTFHAALQYLSYALAGSPYMGVGRNLSYKKSTFTRANGFSSISHIPSGDDDLFVSMVAIKTNTRIVIDRDAFTFSQPETTFAGWARQKTRHFTTGKYYKPAHQALLGLYSLSQFLLLPLFAMSLVLYDWKLSLYLYMLRLCLQAVIYYRCMKKLGESDLFGWWWLFDAWMFFYYIIFANTLWKKPRKSWK